jgi:hypothetical protein
LKNKNKPNPKAVDIKKIKIMSEISEMEAKMTIQKDQ